MAHAQLQLFEILNHLVNATITVSPKKGPIRPGPGSGEMATCLSQLYHEHKRGIVAGYAKFETFPIWNLPLKHPVNLAYEAAHRAR